MCFVAGLNRVGTDGNGLQYSGDSAVIDFLGHPLSECSDEEVVVTTTLQAAQLQAHRERFPAMLDGDRFTLSSGGDRKSVVQGKSVSVGLVLGGRRFLKQQNTLVL